MAARLTAYVVVAIVAATLIAGLIVGAQRDDNDGPVDLIVTNATVYTADRRGTTAEAVAVRGNQILRVGTAREIARLQRPQTIVVDAARRRGSAWIQRCARRHDRRRPRTGGGRPVRCRDGRRGPRSGADVERGEPAGGLGHRQGLDAGPVPRRPADAPHARRGRQGPAGALLRVGRERAVGVGELAGTEACRHHPDYRGIRAATSRARAGAANPPGYSMEPSPRCSRHRCQGPRRRTDFRPCGGPSPKRIRGASPARRTRPPTVRRTSICSTASAVSAR